MAKQERVAGDTDLNSFGLVQVVYGSPSGFRPQASQQWSRPDAGERPRRSYFGFGLTHGDLNGDAYSDLVVGDPGITNDGYGAGDVHIFYGSAIGLSRARVQKWSLDSPGLREQAKTGDGFGAAVTIGELGRGRQDDLAIGMPRRNGAGAVLVLFGGADGLTTGEHQMWNQGTKGMPGRPERDDDFGLGLATGDFDGDRHDELVIGARYDKIAGVGGAGSVHVLRGTSEGPTADGAQHWTPGRDGLPGEPGDTALFGDSFAVGAFTGGDHLDLAIGSPGWDSSDTGGAGAVYVLYGSPTGLSARGNQRWTEYELGTRQLTFDEPEDSPLFGTSLAAADFGRGPADDLVVGVPESLTPGWASGSVQILYGAPAGLTSTHSRQISQVTPGLKGFDDDEALFGSALSVLAATGPDDFPTLVVGAPDYGGGDEDDRSGIVHLIDGSTNGLTSAHDQVVTARQLPQQPPGERFGWRLTS